MDDFYDDVCSLCRRMFKVYPDLIEDEEKPPVCEICARTCAHCGGDLTLERIEDESEFCSPDCEACDKTVVRDPDGDFVDCADLCHREPRTAVQDEVPGACAGCGESRLRPFGCSCNDELTTVFEEDYDA